MRETYLCDYPDCSERFEYRDMAVLHVLDAHFPDAPRTLTAYRDAIQWVKEGGDAERIRQIATDALRRMLKGA